MLCFHFLNLFLVYLFFAIFDLVLTKSNKSFIFSSVKGLKNSPLISEPFLTGEIEIPKPTSGLQCSLRSESAFVLTVLFVRGNENIRRPGETLDMCGKTLSMPLFSIYRLLLCAD